MKRIGLFGGTFNPIHLGHLRAGEEVGELFGLDPVIFIPSASPPHKPGGEIVAAPRRLEMVRLAVADNPRFSVSAVELERPGKSYSVETVSHFRRIYGADTPLHFILGLDAFREIDTWKEYAALFSLCHFILMTRPGSDRSPASLPIERAEAFCYDEVKNVYVHRTGGLVFPAEITALDISGTKIRERLSRGSSIRYLLPAAVEEFIYRHKLYQTEAPKH
ncbi:MAG: nicotinate-nucleotide adenylyltransferase [Deltaproteobacteria bacterium]|nr:nicotinate-nucleotide adenylyltransferase [Deltaproteobacteria bacterium]